MIQYIIECKKSCENNWKVIYQGDYDEDRWLADYLFYLLPLASRLYYNNEYQYRMSVAYVDSVDSPPISNDIT
jgi:hypothetical protein